MRTELEPDGYPVGMVVEVYTVPQDCHPWVIGSRGRVIGPPHRALLTYKTDEGNPRQLDAWCQDIALTHSEFGITPGVKYAFPVSMIKPYNGE